MGRRGLVKWSGKGQTRNGRENTRASSTVSRADLVISEQSETESGPPRGRRALERGEGKGETTRPMRPIESSRGDRLPLLSPPSPSPASSLRSSASPPSLRLLDPIWRCDACVRVPFARSPAGSPAARRFRPATWRRPLADRSPGARSVGRGRGAEMAPNRSKRDAGPMIDGPPNATDLREARRETSSAGSGAAARQRQRARREKGGGEREGGRGGEGDWQRAWAGDLVPAFRCPPFFPSFSVACSLGNSAAAFGRVASSSLAVACCAPYTQKRRARLRTLDAARKKVDGCKRKKKRGEKRGKKRRRKAGKTATEGRRVRKNGERVAVPRRKKRAERRES